MVKAIVQWLHVHESTVQDFAYSGVAKEEGGHTVSGVARGQVGARASGRRPWGRTRTLFEVN